MNHNVLHLLTVTVEKITQDVFTLNEANSLIQQRLDEVRLVWITKNGQHQQLSVRAGQVLVPV